MNLMRKFSWVVLALSVCTNAMALDSSPGVRVFQLMKTGSSWNHQPIFYPRGRAEITAMRVEIAPGAATGWHAHAVPSFAVILEGELEVFLRNGQSRRLKAGDVLAEVVDTFHNGRNVGNTPVKLVVFYAGAEGLPNTIKQP